jgi:wyosine [tRNA(Phe)-imidazoG37] synthetase (radical SAM superfamily)
MSGLIKQIDKTIYGPVLSWRFGKSLGIDVIFEISTCSFNCIYCQLGQIQRVTPERKVYISSEKVINDLKEFLSKNIEFDVITFSGSGEPTLATNLGEIASEIKKLCPDKPLQVLTNSTMLLLPEVQKDLELIDRVICKLDAANDKTLKQINRPAENINIENIVAGIKSFKKSFKGILDIQMMFMPLNLAQIEDLANLLNEIQPASVQLNTPLRPYPMQWHRENRGNHLPEDLTETRQLKVISKEEAEFIEKTLKERTGLNILSVYRE